MPSFKNLTLIHFEYPLKLFELMAIAIKKDGDTSTSAMRLSNLTESIFLQMYSQLEASLYQECAPHCIKKNASIARFESALNEQGYVTNSVQWNRLIHLSKIRNCLLHGNGRLDADRYGEDTRNTINAINLDANETLIDVVNVTRHSEGVAKINLLEGFPGYCFIKIQEYIDSITH